MTKRSGHGRGAAWSDVLSDARCFEEASEVLLRALLDLCAEGLSGWSEGTLLRGQIQLQGRRKKGLAVLDLVEGRVCWPDPEHGPQHGATAWHWVRRGRGPVAMDVVRRAVVTLGRDQHATEHEPTTRWRRSFASHEFYTRRQTTHLLALPVHEGEGGLLGVATVELASALTLDELMPRWRAVLPSLEEVTQAAGPVLASLPVRGVALDAGGLPVVGEVMRGLLSSLQAFARLDQLVLLRGPTGVGKTHLARWVHRQSPRSRGPFVVADLVSTPATGQEVALFGVVDGFFSEVRAHGGWVGEAAGGTLFIDEIDKLSLEAQARLLRLLDQREYSVVGDSRSRRADVRVVVATNADLNQAVREGRFRDDLRYRVDCLSVEVPTLRERRDEIAGWAQYMLEQLELEESVNQKRSAEQLSFDDAVIAQLVAREWPGNLRELGAVVRRTYAVRRGARVIGLRALEAAEALGGRSGPAGGGSPDGAAGGMVRAAGAAPTVEGLQARLEQIAAELLAVIEARRALGLAPLCEQRGDLAMLDWVEAKVLEGATARKGRLKEALELLGLGKKAAAGNGARLRKWMEEVLGRVKLK